MTANWEKTLSCATQCSRCNVKLSPPDQRILSIYDHTPICLACKQQEEARPDYAETSKSMIGACMAETEALYGDPGGYCYYHFTRLPVDSYQFRL